MIGEKGGPFTMANEKDLLEELFSVGWYYC